MKNLGPNVMILKIGEYPRPAWFTPERALDISRAMHDIFETAPDQFRSLIAPLTCVLMHRLGLGPEEVELIMATCNKEYYDRQTPEARVLLDTDAQRYGSESVNDMLEKAKKTHAKRAN